jgi:polysaccharide biosynthesis protein PslH
MRSAWNCTKNLPRPLPLQAVYSWQPRLMNELLYAVQHRNGSKAYDVIHVEHLRGARYAEELHTTLRATGDTTPVIWDSVDCISFLFEQAAHESSTRWNRFVTGHELGRTRWYEAWLVRQFERVLVTSDLDRRAFFDLLNEFAPTGNGHLQSLERIRILPNGVRLEYFTPIDVPRQPQTIVFTGKMSYHANIAAALYLLNQVMPAVWERFPNARLQIVGQNPPHQVSSFATRFPDRVQVTGTVNDLRPYLAQATLAVAPILYGAGIQNKVLEALAMETPLVATSKAIAALDVQNERELLVGDSPEAFAQAIIRLLRNPGLRERLGQSGRAYVQAHHDWHDIAAQLEMIYQETVQANLG